MMNSCLLRNMAKSLSERLQRYQNCRELMGLLDLKYRLRSYRQVCWLMKWTYSRLETKKKHTSMALKLPKIYSTIILTLQNLRVCGDRMIKFTLVLGFNSIITFERLTARQTVF